MGLGVGRGGGVVGVVVEEVCEGEGVKRRVRGRRRRIKEMRRGRIRGRSRGGEWGRVGVKRGVGVGVEARGRGRRVGRSSSAAQPQRDL